ncbi:hypothetical protein JW930_01985 [Candidatus Woesearchaeota archaeon]|nr:hypothetical protein [Candidatus Woesearchaeota archaeon]
MKKVLLALVAAFLMAAMAAAKQECTTIQSGQLLSSTGETLATGYDVFGYNYQAHMFNGRYCDYDRVLGGDYCDVKLMMKWNDAWLSNKDCDGDNLLDRHYGFAGYIGSGAWLTNHEYEEYAEGCYYDYFVKIVAAPSDAYLDTGVWYAADGTRIGAEIWGAFAITQENYYDSCDPEAGYEMHERFPGLGNW